MWLTCVLLLILYEPIAKATIPVYSLTVNTSVTVGKLEHFWKSTGFCPPEPHDQAYGFDLGSDMRQNLAFIGAIPHNGIQQVRIHWLLDLVSVKSMSATGPVYDFDHLDDLLDLLYQSALRPGFELMGNPSHFFSDFDNKTQVYLWRDLVHKTAQRYIDQYGLGEVMTWNFETWNEPDCKDFDDVSISVQGFLNYYDACSEGLKAASPLLKLGGPGDGCHHNKYSDAFLQHVVEGKNFFTGETGVRVDFLSYHKKGGGSSKAILDQEEMLMKSISDRFPSLANKPFFNDEADPLVGWSKDEWWRADCTYAAIIAKIIGQHQNLVRLNPASAIKNYTLLSNDNGFLSWYPHQFTERTLLARFQINNTSPPYTQLFRKPVYSVMGLLSKLGETQVQASITPSPSQHKTVPLDDDFGVIASVHTPDIPGTSDSWQLSMLVYYSNDTTNLYKSLRADITLHLNPPNNTDLMLVVWAVDNWLGNPHGMWEKIGKPKYPTLNESMYMRRLEGAQVIIYEPVKDGVVSLAKYAVGTPSVMLFHVCARPAYQPDQVNGLNILNITRGQILLTWSDGCVNSKCILKFEVEYSSKSPDGPYTRLTGDYVYRIDTAFVYQPLAGSVAADPDDLVRGYYRVRAIDYWKQAGEFSLPEPYPDSL